MGRGVVHERLSRARGDTQLDRCQAAHGRLRGPYLSRCTMDRTRIGSYRAVRFAQARPGLFRDGCRIRLEAQLRQPRFSGETLPRPPYAYRAAAARSQALPNRANRPWRPWRQPGPMANGDARLRQYRGVSRSVSIAGRAGTDQRRRVNDSESACVPPRREGTDLTSIAGITTALR